MENGTNTLIPPLGFKQAYERFGLDFHGWFIESAEGFRSRYPDADPDKTIALVTRLAQRRAAENGE